MMKVKVPKINLRSINIEIKMLNIKSKHNVPQDSQ